MTAKIAYPYLPEGRSHQYAKSQNPYIVFAKNHAHLYSLDKTMPGTAVVVSRKTKAIIGVGANGSLHHKSHGCRRVELGCKSGEGYDLCEGCHPRNHSEARALRHASAQGHDCNGADLYLWGHWFCCERCWALMLYAGIDKVILMKDSQILFNKEHPDNIVGRQFAV